MISNNVTCISTTKMLGTTTPRCNDIKCYVHCKEASMNAWSQALPNAAESQLAACRPWGITTGDLIFEKWWVILLKCFKQPHVQPSLVSWSLLFSTSIMSSNPQCSHGLRHAQLFVLCCLPGVYQTQVLLSRGCHPTGFPSQLPTSLMIVILLEHGTY